VTLSTDFEMVAHLALRRRKPAHYRLSFNHFPYSGASLASSLPKWRAIFINGMQLF
jgi:hypothetical protein